MFSSVYRAFVEPVHFPTANFEDVQATVRAACSNNTGGDIAQDDGTLILQPLMITTIPSDILDRNGGFLISGTLPLEKEEEYINGLLLDTAATDDLPVIIYGQNAADETAHKKAEQLYALGFRNLHIYRGGLFEWCLLRDIYGNAEFSTTPLKDRIFDPLCYKNCRVLDI